MVELPLQGPGPEDDEDRPGLLEDLHEITEREQLLWSNDGRPPEHGKPVQHGATERQQCRAVDWRLTGTQSSPDDRQGQNQALLKPHAR